MTSMAFRIGWGCLLALGLALAGCTSEGGTGTEGSVNVGLQLGPGVNVDEVSYEITGNGVDLTGTLTIGNSLGAPLSAVIAGVPEGMGYTLNLTAQSTGTDGTVDCAGSAMFDIVANQTTNVEITLNCAGDHPRGTVDINGQFDWCPVLTSATASPSFVAVGDVIYVTAMATDSDSDPLAYAWTATSGSYDDASASQTTYNCEMTGDQVLTVTVDDGRGCTDSLDMNVTCGQGAVCGNGTVETGEQCDDGNTVSGDGCSSTCTLEPVCGNGTVEAGEQCDDGNTVSGDGCSSTCQLEAVCGNGVVEAGEECDDGNTVSGDGCSSTCTIEQVDLTGTWISHIQTTGVITAPTIGSQPANIDIIQRLLVAANGSNLDMTLQICSLNTSSDVFSVIYPQAAIDTFVTMTTVPTPMLTVGDAVPIPSFEILSGWDGTNAVDSDGDGTPGIFVTAVLGGTLMLPSDIGITITTSVTGSLSDANTIAGTVAFATNGTVFDIGGSPPPGDPAITVVTDTPTVPFTTTRLAGDVSCTDVIAMFP